MLKIYLLRKRESLNINYSFDSSMFKNNSCLTTLFLRDEKLCFLDFFYYRNIFRIYNLLFDKKK
jgi:hypothetical protein